MTRAAGGRFLRVEEAARILGIPISSAYELARRDLLPVIRLGRRVRILAAGLDAIEDDILRRWQERSP